MSDQVTPDITMDVDNLYKEEMYTDQKIGTIRKMQPVLASGENDDSRPVLFLGQAQMMTPAGALPLSFDLEADDLAQAIEKFGEAAAKALEDTMEELKELRRQQASQIVVPGQQGSPQIQMP